MITSPRFRRWRRRWLPSLPLATMVFCFWLLLNDQVTTGHVLMALVLALLIPPFAARLDREFARIGSLRGVPRMFGILLLDIVRSNITVALQVLGPEERITPGFIWVPLDIANIHGIAALTSIITLTPGTVSAALSDDRRYLLVHVLHLEDADEVVRQIKSRYEGPLMEIFP
ncbi:Na+/H+ antiporter subunit E [Pseudoxanthomonas daejeonensis]|uniref:Na+/H+ antiporter subunit E n=1 Tax=Pseudoxanthomonas daejeonensis TaxID=266062 RepID=A0ABQ6ZAU4_9GAMM|nr:Na+/H+ antiporter subunit E [Pseudoxanthomonas daejeonensis]KAF1696997.1 Na+/H+ antiporter subunit E [Pseudoxanthomonas daejeonensis]UNK56392.1 Na+/H+ antiporter subunit E [Pseudoxanthomonas daejeonensis]